jgi:hypothetical protein
MPKMNCYSLLNNCRAIASTFAIRTKPTHRAKIAKELASQRTSGHTLLLLDTGVQVKHPTEGRTYNRGFSAMLADGRTISC